MEEIKRSEHTLDTMLTAEGRGRVRGWLMGNGCVRDVDYGMNVAREPLSIRNANFQLICCL